MQAIQERIQPKFRVLGERLVEDLSILLGNEMYLHIAKHARRTVNPPKDTWLAVCHHKRGYKQHPHFQVGLFDDRLFIWLAFIYELPNKRTIAGNFLQHMDELRSAVPEHFVVSTDHMKKDAQYINELDLEWTLRQFRDVKKAELLLGQHVASNDPILSDGSALYEKIMNTFETLVPLYMLSFR